MSYTELFNVISQQWAGISEIRKISNNCCRDKAIKIRDDIEAMIKREGKRLPQTRKKVVPTEYVLKYLNMDYNYILQMALNEKKVKDAIVRTR